jgi:hypothetical protein
MDISFSLDWDFPDHAQTGVNISVLPSLDQALAGQWPLGHLA